MTMFVVEYALVMLALSPLDVKDLDFVLMSKSIPEFCGV